MSTLSKILRTPFGIRRQLPALTQPTERENETVKNEVFNSSINIGEVEPQKPFIKERQDRFADKPLDTFEKGTRYVLKSRRGPPILATEAQYQWYLKNYPGVYKIVTSFEI